MLSFKSNSLVLVIALFIPALRKIKAERFAILRIFLTVPKSTVSAICHSLDKSQHKDIEESALDDSVGDVVYFEKEKNNTLPILKKIIIRYSLFFGTFPLQRVCTYLQQGVTFAMAICMFFVCYTCLEHTTESVPSIVMAGKRVAVANQLKFLSFELIQFDNNTWSSRADIRAEIAEAVANMQSYQSALLYGNQTLGVHETVLESFYQRELHYEYACTWAEEIDFGSLEKLRHGGCQGISSLYYPFIRDISLLSAMPDDTLNWNNTFFQRFYLTEKYCK